MSLDPSSSFATCFSPLHSCSFPSFAVSPDEDVQYEYGIIISLFPTTNLSSLLSFFKDNKVFLINAKYFCDFKYILTLKSLLHTQKDLLTLANLEFPLLSIMPYLKNSKEIPWFPRSLEDLDTYTKKTLQFGDSLSSDHPGFTDHSYRERRQYIIEKSLSYRFNLPLPEITYTKEEIETWSLVYGTLKELYPTHACKEFLKIFPLLELMCDYSPYEIPSFNKVSNFLHHQTGFRLRPVQGLLSSRDFLNSLALRVFHCTQYIRHPSTPLYTPEPDCCHELLGHVPLFADKDFADFSHEIGLASLGASDSLIQQLSTIYWYTVEFGLCEEDEGRQIKAFGAGLLSSFGELKHSLLTDTPKSPFNPWEQSKLSFPICSYQPMYYVAKSFTDAKEKMLLWLRDVCKDKEEFYLDYQRGIIRQVLKKDSFS